MKFKVNRSKIAQSQKRNSKWRVGEKFKVSPHKPVRQGAKQGQLHKPVVGRV